MRTCKNLAELKKQFAKVQRPVWGANAYQRLTAEALLLLLEQLNKKPPARTKRPLTAWQRFMTAGVRDGLGLQEISHRWQEQKRLKIG